MTTPSDTGPVAPTINRSTLIPLGAAFGILMALVSAWGYLESKFGIVKESQNAVKQSQDSRFTAVDKALEKQDRRLEKLEDSAASDAGARWTRTDQALWQARFKNLNPELKLPQ
jgi:hypothetical protein